MLADLAEQADVVVLVETTQAAQTGLAAEGWDDRFPYAVGDPRDEGSNTAVFSRFRLSRGTLLGRSNFSQWSVAVEVPDLGLVRLLAVHPCNPYCGGGRWYVEHEVVRAAAVANRERTADRGRRLQRRRRPGADAAAAPARAAQRHRPGRGRLAADLSGRRSCCRRCCPSTTCCSTAGSRPPR